MSDSTIINEVFNIVKLFDTSYISNKYNIRQLIRKYISLYKEAQQRWESQYIHIENYKSYVYRIHDTIYNKEYIGVRYTPHKHNYDLLEDLLIYQSSSTNKNFKNRLKKNIKEFKLTILKEFDNEFDAQNYEALLHQIFKIDINDIFYNKTSECFIEYKTYFTPLYDLQENKEIYYKDIKHFVSYSGIKHLVNKKIKTKCAYNRFCLIEDIEYVKQNFINYNRLVSLYTIYNNVIIEVIKPYYEWKKILKGDIDTMLQSESRKSVMGYFKCVADCEYFYKNKYEIIGLYYVYNNLVCYHQDSRYNWIIKLGYSNMGELNKLISGKRRQLQGYYYQKQLCEDALKLEEIIILYTYENEKMVAYSKTFNEWKLLLGITELKRLVSDNKGYTKGFYINKMELIDTINDLNDTNTLYTIGNYTIIPVTKSNREWKTFLGNSGDYNIMINKSTKRSIKGYYKYEEDCIKILNKGK